MVFAIDIPTCDENVTLGVAREGVDPLIQYHYCVQHVALNEVKLECAAARRPPWESYHQTRNVVCPLRKQDSVRPGLVWGVWGGGETSAPLVNPHACLVGG